MSFSAKSELIVAVEGGVAILTISNSSQKNALTRVIFEQGLDFFRMVKRNQDVRAIVLRGSGENFSAGGDLSRMVEQRTKPKHTQAEHLDICHSWVLAMRDCPQPIIAAVEGAATGGGLALALACDLNVVADDAKLIMSHSKIGLSPDCGATHWLMQSLPHQTALEVMLDAAPISALRLYELGVVNRVVPKDTTFQTAVLWASKLANGPRVAQGWIKKLAYEAQSSSLADQLDAERDALIETLYGPECEEGLKAFQSKRKPNFPSVK